MDLGRLVPDDIMIGIVKEVLHSSLANKGFILDGFPRTIEQAKALAEILDELHITDHKVINLEVNDEVIIRRLAKRLVCQNEGRIFNTEVDRVTADGPCPMCGGRLVQRDDDKEETVRRRLSVYHSSTAPVLRYYQSVGVVLTIDGSVGVDEVHMRLKELLNK